MAAYNKVNGDYAGGNRVLLKDVLKGAWGYRGWVMSDWGATPGWECALAGLDQESRRPDRRRAVAGGAVRRAAACRLRRRASCPRSACRTWCGASCARCTPSESTDGSRPAGGGHGRAQRDCARDRAAGHRAAAERRRAAAGADCARIAVIGGYAQLGVPAGCGSSAVVPPGGYAAVIPIGGPGSWAARRNLYLLPSSPLEELTKASPERQIEFDPGISPAEAVLVARGRRRDRVRDPGRRRGLRRRRPVAAVGPGRADRGGRRRQPEHVVVLETGNPVAMPWRDTVNAIVAGVVSGPGRRPGHRRNHCRRGQSVRPAADHLPGRPRPDAAARAARLGDAVGHADHHPTTPKAPRSATAGSPARARRRCSRSATASATPASSTPISR